MSAGSSIAERLAMAARAMRSPLTLDLDGGLSPVGAANLAALQTILDELPEIEARTPADALALVSVANMMVPILAAHADGDEVACAAITTLVHSLLRLRACLSEMAGQPASDFALWPVAAAPAAGSH